MSTQEWKPNREREALSAGFADLRWREFMKMFQEKRMIPMKQWLAERAQECGLTPDGVWWRLRHGKYPQMKLKRKNKRVVFVVDEMRVSP